MVKLDKIYTRTGDKGQTRLSTGEQVDKWHPRVASYGSVDEVNSALGVAALHADDEMLTAIRRIQNDLFDLGADLGGADEVVDGDAAGHQIEGTVGERQRRLAVVEVAHDELAHLAVALQLGPVHAQRHAPAGSSHSGCGTLCACLHAMSMRSWESHSRSLQS